MGTTKSNLFLNVVMVTCFSLGMLTTSAYADTWYLTVKNNSAVNMPQLSVDLDTTPTMSCTGASYSNVLFNSGDQKRMGPLTDARFFGHCYYSLILNCPGASPVIYDDLDDNNANHLFYITVTGTKGNYKCSITNTGS